MNHYGQLARRHWQTHLPSRVAALSNPDVFFEDLGQQVAEEIDELASSLEQQHAQEHPPGESFLTRAGQLSTARQTAESTVLREWVLLPPEETEPSSETSHPND